MQDMSGGVGGSGTGAGSGPGPGGGTGRGSGHAGGFGPGLMPGYGGGQPLLALTLGVAMARRAADILGRHRDAHDRAAPGPGSSEATQFALDDAIFTAVLDAANECLGQFDPRPPADRWCDALLHLLDLARYTPGTI